MALVLWDKKSRNILLQWQKNTIAQWQNFTIAMVRLDRWNWPWHVVKILALKFENKKFMAKKINVLLIYKSWNTSNTWSEISVYNVFCWNVPKMTGTVLCALMPNVTRFYFINDIINQKYFISDIFLNISAKNIINW